MAAVNLRADRFKLHFVDQVSDSGAAHWDKVHVRSDLSLYLLC